MLNAIIMHMTCHDLFGLAVATHRNTCSYVQGKQHTHILHQCVIFNNYGTILTITTDNTYITNAIFSQNNANLHPPASCVGIPQLSTMLCSHVIKLCCCWACCQQLEGQLGTLALELWLWKWPLVVDLLDVPAICWRMQFRLNSNLFLCFKLCFIITYQSWRSSIPNNY